MVLTALMVSSSSNCSADFSCGKGCSGRRKKQRASLRSVCKAAISEGSIITPSSKQVANTLCMRQRKLQTRMRISSLLFPPLDTCLLFISAVYLRCMSSSWSFRAATSFIRFAVSVLPLLSKLTFALLTTEEAREANLSVFIVSSWLLSAGEIQANRTVMPLPPSESFSKRVNFDSRYGTWTWPVAMFLLARAATTFPSANKPLFIETPLLHINIIYWTGRWERKKYLLLKSFSWS